jgi:hypothetical protein
MLGLIVGARSTPNVGDSPSFPLRMVLDHGCRADDVRADPPRLAHFKTGLLNTTFMESQLHRTPTDGV